MKYLHDIPLRERKQARSRLALLNAAVERMREKALADITVEELCQAAEVSKGTFFRYFARKVDLIFYYIRLWSIEVTWRERKAADSTSSLALIEALFEWTAAVYEDHPRIMSEMIALRAFEPQEFARIAQNDIIMVSKAERLIRFPKCEGIEEIPEGSFHPYFRRNLQAAIAKGELPKNTDIDSVVLSLACIFYGVPLMLDDRAPCNLAPTYLRQLRLLWIGLRASTGSAPVQ